MTEPQTQNRCREFQSLFPEIFGGWRIHVNVTNSGVPKDAEAMVEIAPDRKSANITIRPKTEESRDILLLHELCHVAVDPYYNTQTDEAKEALVWTLANALFGLLTRSDASKKRQIQRGSRLKAN